MVTWFLRAQEGDDGSWACRRGRESLDLHPHADLKEAVAHLREVAESIDGAAQIVLHFSDGSARLLDDEP
jgi:hypothetical protein